MQSLCHSSAVLVVFPVIVSLLLLRLTMAWYLWYSAKLPPDGALFGWQFHSPLVRSLLTNVQFLWLLFLLNAGFTLVFYFGLRGMKSFSVLLMIDIAAIAFSAVIFGIFVSKDRFDLPMGLGMGLVTIGTILIVGHEFFVQWMK